MSPIDLSDAEIERYARHILLPEVGGVGQMRLKQARVLVIGAGGLGCPLLLYLAAAGIGTLGVVDADAVQLSNLQRQILYTTPDIGQPKVAIAADHLARLNPEIQVHTVPDNLTPENADRLIASYDLVCDATDNFTARFAIADACCRQRRTLVTAAVQRNTVQLAVFKPHVDPALPCYRCLNPHPTAQDGLSCADAGILGAITGVAGTLQATLALQEILGVGGGLTGKLLIWDALSFRFRLITVPVDPTCPHHPSGSPPHG